MEIIHRQERLNLTNEEREVLNNARSLLLKIYDEAEAEDSEIWKPANNASDAIDNLFDYCE